LAQGKAIIFLQANDAVLPRLKVVAENSFKADQKQDWQ
jgi:hypothetical protein